MPSVRIVTGIPSRWSSQAVSRAPWKKGRVSSASTEIGFPPSHAARTTPSAVPYAAVARAPALQWVSTFAARGTSGAPSSPMRRQEASSSSRIAWASASTASGPAANRARTRATAQARFTAVGRAAAIRSAAAASASAGTPRSASAASP